MNDLQRRLMTLATRLPDADDRAACLLGAKAIEAVRDVHTITAGWDGGADLASKLEREGVPASCAVIPHGDY